MGEPMFVCFGVDVRGGGSRGVFRNVIVSVGSGAEPEITRRVRTWRLGHSEIEEIKLGGFV